MTTALNILSVIGAFTIISLIALAAAPVIDPVPRITSTPEDDCEAIEPGQVSVRR